MSTTEMEMGLFETQMDSVLLLQCLLQIQNFLSFPTSLNPGREVGSPAAPSNGFIFSFRVLVPGNGTAISGPHYEDVVTSFANRSTSKAQVPSNAFHQSSIPSPPSTAPPSYRNNETASPSTSLTSDRNGSPSLRVPHHHLPIRRWWGEHTQNNRQPIGKQFFIRDSIIQTVSDLDLWFVIQWMINNGFLLV